MADLLETKQDGVAILTMNRPEARNALSQPMLGALLEALPRLAADPTSAPSSSPARATRSAPAAT